MKFNNCFWSHNWDKWKPVQYTVTDTWSKDKTPLKAMYQDRKCKICGKIQSEQL